MNARRFILPLLAVALLTESCTTDPMEEAGSQNGTISFTRAETPTQATTRGSLTTLANIGNFGVSAAIYPAAGGYASAKCGSYFRGIEVSAASGTTNYLWPASDYKLSFYAYAPYGNANVTLADANTIGRMQYTYTVPASIASQIDFMTAESLDHACPSASPVSLTFAHRLTDIQFEAYNQQQDVLTVKSISVCGVQFSGTYTTGNSWSLTGSKNNLSSHPFTLALNTNVASGATVNLTGDNNHFLMLPQTVTTGTDFLVVTTQEDGETRTYTYTQPSDFELVMGKSFTFKLTLGNGKMTVQAPTSITDWQPVETVTGGFSIQNWQAQ